MAPVSDHKYFPSLEQCLSGEKVLLSWKLVATALSDCTGQRQKSPAIVSFFDDEYIRGLLKDPSTAFAPSSVATVKDFETKLAPINVTSASTDRIDIKLFKEDAEWLSKNAKVNLVAALRIVLIEHQSRACRHLLGPLSSQDAANLQEAAGLQNGQGSAFLSEMGASAALDADEISAEFEKPESRRRRLFSTLLDEKRFFMAAADYANSIKLYKRLPIFSPGDVKLSELYSLESSAQPRDEMESLLPAYIGAVTDSMGAIEAGVGSVTDDPLLHSEDVELDWLRSLLTETVHGLSVVLQLVDRFGSDFPPSSVISQWYSLMEVYGFFDNIQPIDSTIAELIMPLKSLVAAISIGLLKPSRALTYLSDRDEDPARANDIYDSYLISPDVLEQVHKSILDAAGVDSESASPVIFAWSFLLHRLNVSYQNRTDKRDNLIQQSAREKFETRSIIRPVPGRRNSAGSIFSIESSKFDGFLENASTPRDMQVVEQLAATATAQGKVFEVMSRMAESLSPSIKGCMTPLVSSRARCVFLELLKVSYPFVGYQSDSVSCLLSLLSPGRGYWDISPLENLAPSQDILASMIQDDYAMEFYFKQALDRHPYEFLPFMALCRTLCTVTAQIDDERTDLILNLLRNTPTITFTLPDGFQGYELVQEEENTNSFCILEEVPLISLSSSWSRRYIEDDAYRIPVGTLGRFITDTGRIVTMDYPHSSLSLLGRQLEINLAKEGYRSELGMLQPDETAEVIALLASLLRAEQMRMEKGANGTAISRQEDDLLSETSKHISGGKDIVTVVCETMDYFMHDELAMTEDTSVHVLTACVNFLHAVLQIQPSRVWSYLARTELLNSESRAGKLSKITGSLDLVSERFEFLTSSLSLFSGLIDTVVTSAVQRRAVNQASARQAESNPWIGTADKVLSRVSFAIAQTAVDVFENTSTWVFDSEMSRATLLQTVVPILNNIILYSYDMGDSPTSENLTLCLRPAASHIIDSFLAPSSGSLRFQPFLSSFVCALTSADSTFYPQRTQTIRSQVISVLGFSTTLLRVANYLERQSTLLETYFFKTSTLVARLGAASDYFRRPVLWLLESLVVNAGQSTNEPPSLLGYLGPQISKSFLQLLSNIGQPFVLPQDVKTTWKFFSAILRNRQQWMSNCLLTGQTPREAMKKESKANEFSSDSVFATALSKLKGIQTLEAGEALVVLDFVASAQNYWPWTVFTLQKDTAYTDGLRAYVRELKSSQITVKSDPVRAATEARIAAYIAETFAMQLYHSRHLGNADALSKGLVNDLDYYLRDGVEVASYNKSLHNNFAKNFSKKYYGISLHNFKRTTFEPRELGENYYYDLDRADEILRFDPGWLGRKENGFQNEMKLANANLSLVDAQVALFHSWEFLLLELSTCLPDNDATKKHMMQVAQQCLNANQGVPGPESIFLKILDARADLSLILVQRLAKGSLVVKDVNQLLETLVGTINGVEEPFAPVSIAYYRTLLKALFVTLRAYQTAEATAGSGSQVDLEGSVVMVTQTILNVLDHVVGRGFRSLVSLIHDEDADVFPEDLALLTAIMQACLSVPNIEQSQTQILNIMASHDATHAATSLYSWADKLTDKGDPVYGELSILFLLELSTLPALAEQLACDGVLGSILSANLTKFLLRSKVSPYDDAAIAQRCYGIWVKGLLPMMLNLLTALGATVAPEITYVLNQFPHLLRASVDRFEAPGASRTKEKSIQYLTLLGTSEIHSLALLTRVLAALRMNNSRDIPAVEWDATGLLENVDYWLTSRRLLKERLLPLGQREMEWRGRKLAGPGDCDNVLEEKIVAQLETVRDVLSSEEFES